VGIPPQCLECDSRCLNGTGWVRRSLCTYIGVKSVSFRRYEPNSMSGFEFRSPAFRVFIGFEIPFWGLCSYRYKIIKRLERFESHLKPSRNSFHLACLLSSNSYALRPCLPSQPFLTPLFGDGPQVHRQGLPVWNSSRLPAAEFCLMAESLRLSGPGDHRCSQHRTAICLLMLCSPLLYHNSHVQTLH